MRLAEIIYLCPDHGAVTPNSGACPFCAVEVTGYVPAEEIERLQGIIAEAPDWGEQYLREMDERKRQGDRAHKWHERALKRAQEIELLREALIEIRDAVEPGDPIFMAAASALAAETDEEGRA